jgi:Nucleoside 2-deoxyribosyltransferase
MPMINASYSGSVKVAIHPSLIPFTKKVNSMTISKMPFQDDHALSHTDGNGSRGPGSPDALTGLDVFIGGPLQHAIELTGFHSGLRNLISAAVGEIERSGGNVFSAHRIERFGADTAIFTPEQVSVRDMRWMRKCDVFVAVLPTMPDETLLRTDGTYVELGWATALGRPIVVITKQPFVDSASHLLKGLHCVSSVQAIDVAEFHADPSTLIACILHAAIRERERSNPA